MIAAAVLVQLWAGATFDGLDMYDPADVEVYKAWMPLHKSLGLTILALMLVRWWWRATHPVPALPADVPAWQRIIAGWHHRTLYALLLVQPVLGLAQSSAYGAKTMFWGVVRVPSIVPPEWSRPVTDVVRKGAQDLHAWVGWALALLISVHVAAALYHHFARQDGILLRMLTGRQPGGAS